jgi:hypothetical protein
MKESLRMPAKFFFSGKHCNSFLGYHKKCVAVRYIFPKVMSFFSHYPNIKYCNNNDW